jgi:hypothetical protein
LIFFAREASRGRRTVAPKAAAKLLRDKVYDSAELREWMSEHNTKPVIPIESAPLSPQGLPTHRDTPR